MNTVYDNDKCLIKSMIMKMIEMSHNLKKKEHSLLENINTLMWYKEANI